MKIKITGNDWKNCYLHEKPDRKKQVIDDLQKEVDELDGVVIFEEIFEIEVSDHSSAVEIFQVKEINYAKNIIVFSYNGGAS